MIGNVDQQHRVIGEVGVEVVAGDIAALLGAVGVVTIADDPLARGGLYLGHVLLEHANDVGDRLDRADRRRGNVGPGDDPGRVHKVPVGVNETGHQGLAAQVNQLGILSRRLQHLILCAHGQDAPILDCDGLGLRVGVVHGDDVTVSENGDFQSHDFFLLF